MNGFLSNPLGSNFGSQTIVAILDLSFKQYTVFSTFIGFRYIDIQFLITNQGFSCFLLYCRVLAAFVLSVDISLFLSLLVKVERRKRCFSFRCYDNFGSMIGCISRLSSGPMIRLHRLLDTISRYNSINFTCDRQPYIFAAHYRRKNEERKNID